MKNNPPDEAIRELEEDKYYNLITRHLFPLNIFLTILGAWLATRDDVPMMDRVGLTVCQ